MKYSKTALMELSHKYKNVLKKCMLLNATFFVSVMIASSAGASTIENRVKITENTVYKDLTATGISSKTSNNGGVFYLEDAQDVTLTFNGTTKFENNSLNDGGMGGAIGNGWLSTKDADKWSPFTPGGKIIFNGETSFKNNTTNNTNGGGAIFNYGVGTVSSADIIFKDNVVFTGNTVTSGSKSDYIGGGAIHNRGGTIIFDKTATFSENESASKGGAIMNSGTMIFEDVAEFNNNTATKSGGALAIIGGDVTFKKTASFTENSAGNGSAISMSGDSKVTFKDKATFTNNTGTTTLVNNGSTGEIHFENGATFDSNTNTLNGSLQNAGLANVSGGDLKFINNTGSNGGGLKNSGTFIAQTTGDILFDKNVTTSSAGAFDNGGTVTMEANKITFSNNKAEAGYGGSVFNSADISFLGKENIFINNTAEDTKTEKSGGGAIHNRGNTGTATLIVGTSDSINTFDSNTSNAHGGAIVSRAFDGNTQNAEVVINGTTTFSNNKSKLNGGAVWNSAVEDGGTTGTTKFTFNGETTFSSNAAEGSGGAIYNDSEMVFNGSMVFKDNTATSNGGAVYNAGTTTITDSEFSGNTAQNYGGAVITRCVTDGCTAKTTISNSTFKNNTASIGGAVFGWTNSETEISGSTFDSNTADFGGAIYTSTSMKNLTISDSKFLNNTALGTGAVGIFKKASLTNVTFDGNKSTDETSSGGGAVFLGALSQTTIDGGTFTNNTSASVGGAIAVRSTDEGNNSAAKLDIENSTFINNTAKTQGGAVFSTFYNSEKAVDSVYIASSEFTGNSAAEGGAVYNSGKPDVGGNLASMKLKDVTFKDNTATSNGGAVYNAGDGTVNLVGTNTFSNNTVNGVKNDIYNDGTLNVAGSLTLDGGISGSGNIVFDADSTLTAVLDTTKISANSVTTNGADLNLVIGDLITDKTYDFITANTVDQAFNIQENVLYDLSMTKDHQSIIVTKKSTEDIASSTGATSNEANVIAGLTSGTSGNEAFDSLASQIQTSLQSGDPVKIQSAVKAAAAVAPTTAPVTQAITTSTITQVLSAVSSRLSSGITPSGASSGDIISDEGAVWVKGLFNRSRLGGTDGFHAYSRGLAFGAESQLSVDTKVGFGYAYTNSDLKPDDRKSEVDSHSAMIYGEYKPESWYVNAMAAYTWGRHDDQRYALGTLISEKHDVDSVSLQAMTGYDVNLKETIIVTPEIGIRYINTNEKSYTDNLGNKIESNHSDTFTGVAGLKTSFDWQISDITVLKPEAKIALTYDFKRDNAGSVMTLANGSVVSVDGDSLKRFGTELSLGLTTEIDDSIELGISWEGKFRQDYTDNTGMINLKYHF